MNRDPLQPDPGPFGPLPTGVTEADLLDWVEQRAGARAAAIESALRSNPALAAALEEMRVDRAAVSSLPASPAPAGLLDAVERAIERRMLVGLASGDPLSDRPPVSVYRPARSSPFRIGPIRGDAVGRQLALAAGLLLLVGGGAILGMIALRMAGNTTPAPIPLARNDAPKPDPDPQLTPTPGQAPQTPDPGLELATTAGPDVHPTEVDTGSIEPEAAAPTMTLARAAELARQGRLIVRVRSRDLDRTLLRYSRITVDPRNAWRLGENAPGSVIARLQAEPPRNVDPAIEPLLIAWSDPGLLGSPLIPIPEVAIPRVESQRVLPTVFLAQARADDASLRGLLSALDATKVHSAVFEESAVPITDAPLTLDPDAMLWWALDPASWRPWASIPVVVEQRK